MSLDNIKSFECESFRKRLSELAESGAIEDAVFADVIYTAMSKFGIDEEMFRDSFGLSKSAVERWTQKQNLPQPSVRPKIIAWIKENL